MKQKAVISLRMGSLSSLRTKKIQMNKLYSDPGYSFDALRFHTIPAMDEGVPQAGKADIRLWPEVLPKDHRGLIL
jgi:hypothetical protein